MSEQLRRILVVKLGDLGDCVITTPALSALREAQPTARIDLLGSPSATLAIGSDLIDERLRLPRGALEAIVRRGPLGAPTLLAFAAALHKRRFG